MIQGFLDVAREHPYAAVLLSSMIPSFEARFSFLLGIELGLDPVDSFLASSLGAVILALTLALIMGRVDSTLRLFCVKNAGPRPLYRASCLYARLAESRARRLERYTRTLGVLGLIVFVAIPLPGSGIYTGAIAALILGIKGYRLAISLIIGGILSIMLVAMSAGIVKVLW